MSCCFWALGSFRRCRDASQTGRLSVKVVDQAGGSIPGATITFFLDERVFAAVTDNYGEAVFEPPPSDVRYAEASAEGFFSRSIAVTNQNAGEISVTLDVFSCSNGCTVRDSRDHSVHYEERGGRGQLVGSVSEFSGPALPNTQLTLMKADSDVTDTKWHATRSPSMSQRPFTYKLVSQTVSDAQGNFQFAGLEPGWYSLEAVRNGYHNETAKFWIARETLTKPAPLQMINKAGYPFPLTPAPEAAPLLPLEWEALPLTPPHKQKTR